MKFSVAISHINDLGYLEYEPETKTVEVVFADDQYKQKVLDYLHTPVTLQLADDENNFTKVTIEPLASVEDLENALSRMWAATDVHVDWSRPVDYVKNGIRSLKDL